MHADRILEEIGAKLVEHKDLITVILAIIAGVVAYIFAPLKSIIGFFRKKKPDPRDTRAETSVSARDNSPINTGDGVQTVAETASVTVNKGLSVSEFLAIRRELKADLEKELGEADQSEKKQLRDRIAELERQIANPDEALKEAQNTIADLEALLERSSNQIGTERINEAREALERGDFSIADEIFAEVEAAQELNIKEAARAAYGRGEIAEEEVRWADAAKHYARAAQLDRTFNHLFKAREFTWRAGDYTTAVRLGEDLVAAAKESDNREDEASALNEHGLTLWNLGQFEEAVTLYREAMEIDKATIGEQHPHYAIRLNNLASVVRAQGQYEQAETLFRQAIEIGKTTIGEDHPAYAMRLNNLGETLGLQGRFQEAEALYRQAIEIDKATIGVAHPDYAVHVNNLAHVLQEQGRVEEAETLYREAGKITKTTLGEYHPSYAIRLNNLALAVEVQGRVEEAEALYRQAIEIAERRLGSAHPTTQTFTGNLDDLLAQKTED
ncbi:MAG: tetratricopeptide repeat protein [Pseudomonadota bacterium]